MTAREPSAPNANMALVFDRFGTPFDLRQFRVEASLSSAFHCTMHVVSADPDVDLDALMGEHARLEYSLPEWAATGRTHAVWHGVVHHASQGESEPTGLSTYHIELVPDVWLLGLARGYRVHQRKSVVEIATEMLAARNVEHEIRLDASAYPKLDYRVQYDETDLAFFQRILACAGIAWWIEQDGPTSRVILSDDPGAAAPSGPPIAYFQSANDRPRGAWATSLRRLARVKPGVATLRTYDFTRPRHEVAASDGVGRFADLEWYRYRPTVGQVVGDNAESANPVADAKGAVRHDRGALQTLARTRMEELQQGSKTIAFETNVLDLLPGRTLILAHHPRADLTDRRLLVTSSVTTGGVAGGWSHIVEASFADVPHRPRASGEGPRVHSVETAVVVGPPGEELHCDEFGRVRVQFHWDRAPGGNDDSSCWLRVSQGWAGVGAGVFALPRVGEEVLVAFVSGDVDHPVVVGRLHNAINPPPFKLPENKTITGWKTLSTPGSGGYSELSFEDKRDAERVHLRAERDHTIDVGHDRVTDIANDDRVYVRADQSIVVDGEQVVTVRKNRVDTVHADEVASVDGSRSATVHKDLKEHVGGSRHVEIQKDDELVVVGSSVHAVQGELSTYVDGAATLSVGSAAAAHPATLVVTGTTSVTGSESITISSDTEIVLMVGTSFIRIADGDITIGSDSVTARGKDARLLLAEGSAKLKVKSAFQVVSDDAIVLKASTASIGLKSEAKVDGSQVLLNSPNSASDSFDTSTPTVTEIHCEDQDGNAVPYARFRIKLDDGKEIMGFLGPDGKASVEGDISGEITFPDVPTAEEN